MSVEERVQKIKQGLQSKNQDDWLTFDDIEWLIKTVEDQQKELKSWHDDYMPI
jgi:hypothetical protein